MEVDSDLPAARGGASGGVWRRSWRRWKADDERITTVPEVTNQSVGNRSKKASKEARVEAGRKSNLVVAASFGGMWRRVWRRMAAVLVALESRRQDEQDGYGGDEPKRRKENEKGGQRTLPERKNNGAMN